MSGQILIDQCAPTLAGIKTANLFTCSYDDAHLFRQEIRMFNQTLNPKGVYMLALKQDQKEALIYLWRPARLDRDLSDQTSQALLKQIGYGPCSHTACLTQLMGRMKLQSFPHEVGLFLGYPPKDVQGFMEHRDVGCKCFGCWRVYSDEQYARQCFASYLECTRLYQKKYAEGVSLEQLVRKDGIRP